MVLDLPASTEQQRLLCAWPQEFHEQRLPLDCRDAEIRLRGIIGLPELPQQPPHPRQVHSACAARSLSGPDRTGAVSRCHPADRHAPGRRRCQRPSDQGRGALS
jgi:hypothetical protein